MMLRRIAIIALLLLAAAGTMAVQPGKASAAAPMLKLGSKGSTVKDMQIRLKKAGYFKGSYTGRFGPTTFNAVVRFQRSKGLGADGIVGANTWAKLKKMSVKRQSATAVSTTDLNLLARIIHAEARGESYKGKVAVGAVVLNRLHSSKFPKTIRGVIMEKNAFSAVKDGQMRLKPNASAYKAARDALRGVDPTGNALFYYNPSISKSGWFKTRTAVKRIGNHLFTV